MKASKLWRRKQLTYAIGLAFHLGDMQAVGIYSTLAGQEGMVKVESCLRRKEGARAVEADARRVARLDALQRAYRSFEDIASPSGGYPRQTAVLLD